MLTYARIVFGAASALYGVIALMWHDADTWQGLTRLWAWPEGSIVGTCLMAGLIAGGVGLMHPRTAGIASIVLCIVNAVFTIAYLQVVIAAPNTFAPYVGFFEQLSLFAGAIGAYALTMSNSRNAKAVGRSARIGLGICAISFAAAQAVYFQYTASLVPPWIPPSQTFWTVLTTVAFALAALAMLVNVRARLATRLMTLMLALFGLLVWVPRLSSHPRAHGNWSEFAINYLITGAAWIVAEVR